MYIFKVTHLPTRSFYISYSTEDKSTFSPVHNIDPVGFYEKYGSNGHMQIQNVEKSILALGNSIDEITEALSRIAKKYENDRFFDGIKITENKSKPIINDTPKSEVVKTESKIDKKIIKG